MAYKIREALAIAAIARLSFKETASPSYRRIVRRAVHVWTLWALLEFLALGLALIYVGLLAGLGGFG